MNVDPVVGEQIGLADHQRYRDEIAVAQPPRMQGRDRTRRERVNQLAQGRGAHDVAGGVALRHAVGCRHLDAPDPAVGIEGEPLQCASHQDLATALHDLARRRLPHHAGAFTRILEALDQCLHDRRAVLPRSTPRQQRALERVHHGHTEVEPFDALRGPIRRDFVARHAPHLLGVGLEEDREQLFAELVAHPLVEGLRLRHRSRLGVGVGEHASRALDDAEIAQRLECVERIGVELAAVEDARQPRPLDEIVRQDLAPEVDHLLRFREEAMAADIEHEVLVVHGAADAAHIDRILLDHDDRGHFSGQAIGGGQPRRSGADHEHFNID